MASIDQPTPGAIAPGLAAQLRGDEELARPVMLTLPSGQQITLTAAEAADLGRTLLLLAGAAGERQRQARRLERRKGDRRRGTGEGWAGVERRRGERRNRSAAFQDLGWVTPIEPGNPDQEGAP